MKQQLDATPAPPKKRHPTKRQRFLAEMEQVVPWPALVAPIEPYYPKAGKGRRPYPLETMLRIYCLQQWFNLSDPGMEEALYDIPCLRAFAQLEAATALPDETTILNFRHLLERHQLTAALMEAITAHLEQRGLLLRGGTLVDATLIHAPPSTKNRARKRDPEMHQTKKGQQWYFGMKIHIGSDVNSGLVHTVSVTAANVSDISQLPELLREDDRAVFGDKGYVDNRLKRAARQAGVYWGVALKATTAHPLTGANRRRNRRHSAIRSRVEHPFRVLKRQFGYVKVRYQGLVKNAAQVFTLIGLANLYRARHALLA